MLEHTSSSNQTLLGDTAADGPQGYPLGTSGESVETTLVEILNAYAGEGFDADAYAADGGRLLCGTCQSMVSPDHIALHSIRRLEGQSDPSDMVGVVAVICPVCAARATAVLKFGPEASPDEIEIWQRSADARDSEILHGHSAPGESDAQLPAN